jgi:hypothetical protein
MDRNRPLPAWRSAAFAVALFAITVNFLQPLAHAALLRFAPPQALWSVLCNSATADPAHDDGSRPAAKHSHECCLGLAHAVAFAPPATIVTSVDRVAATVQPLVSFGQLTPVGIRDGPHRPRGPPSFV